MRNRLSAAAAAAVVWSIFFCRREFIAAAEAFFYEIIRAQASNGCIYSFQLCIFRELYRYMGDVLLFERTHERAYERVY